MPRTREDRERAAIAASAWVTPQQPELMAVLNGLRAVAAAELELTMAIETARNAEYSWITIGKVLGVSRQAARERYGPRP